MNPSTAPSFRLAHFLLLLAGVSLLLPSLQSAHAQTFYTETGYAEFTSEVPLHNFTGMTQNLTGQVNLEDGTVDFYIDLNTLKTGIWKRDKDLRKTLDTRDHPFAEFFGRLVTPVDPTITDLQPVRVRGNFSIHGVTREIEVEGSVQITPFSLRVLAAWELNLEDYNIEPPGLVIVKVDPVQDIRIDVVMAPIETPGGSSEAPETVPFATAPSRSR